MNEELKTVASKAQDGVKKRGIRDARIVVSQSRNSSVVFRKGRPEKVEESFRRSLALSLYLDGKFTACDTSDLRDDALDSFLDSAVTMCKAMEPDPCREITDPALYQDRQEHELNLFDEEVERVTPEQRHEYAARLEDATAQASGDGVISIETSYDDTFGEAYHLHSNGFKGYKKGSQFWSFAELSLQDQGEKRPEGWAVSGSRFKSELEDPKVVGSRAAQTAKAKLGAKKIETAKMPMILENRSVGRLMGQLLAATSGRAIQQKSSFLDGMLSKQIGSELLHLTDDPFIVGGFGSRLFDSEGISAKQMSVFNKGVLQNLYIDTYYGKKLGKAPTTGGRSNLVMIPGSNDLAGLAAQIDKGVLVRGFIGGNSNPTTGDFSMGVYGTLIEKGKLTDAVAEMNISGSHKQLWQRLVGVGSDVYKFSSLLVPSLVFDDIQFAGI